MEAWTIISLSMAAAACYGALVWLVTKHVEGPRPSFQFPTSQPDRSKP